jgi:hypothetical protein
MVQRCSAVTSLTLIVMLHPLPCSGQTSPAEQLYAGLRVQSLILPTPLSGPTQEGQPSVPGQRSGALAGILSGLVFPGVGSYYAGNSRHGTTHLLLGLATLGGTLGGLAAACDDGFNFCDEDDAGYTIAGIFALGYVVNWVWGIVTAVNDVGSSLLLLNLPPSLNLHLLQQSRRSWVAMRPAHGSAQSRPSTRCHTRSRCL